MSLLHSSSVAVSQYLAEAEAPLEAMRERLKEAEERAAEARRALSHAEPEAERAEREIERARAKRAAAERALKGRLWMLRDSIAPVAVLGLHLRLSLPLPIPSKRLALLDEVGEPAAIVTLSIGRGPLSFDCVASAGALPWHTLLLLLLWW
jgi:hypothetical protein